MSNRMAKVNALIEAELGRALGSRLPGPGVLATVTAVETTPDLHDADGWISLIPDTDEAWEQVEALRLVLQQDIAGRIKLKYTPRLRLRRDRSAAVVARVDTLLKGQSKPRTGK